MKRFLLPTLLIIVGLGWLLKASNLFPQIEWVWTVGLFAVGVLVIVGLGLDKLTFTVGGALIISSVFSVLRQSGIISLSLELPILVIVLGILWIIGEATGLKNPPPVSKL